MEYTQDIILELNSNTAYTTVGAKQGDHNSRKINVHITSNGTDYNLQEEGVNSAYFRFRKPDGKAIINTATINTTNNVVEIILTAQTLAVSGRGYADITLLSGSTILSTVSFILIIMSSPQVANQAVSSDEFGYLNQVVEDATHIIYEAEAWANGTRGGVNVFGNNSFVPTKESIVISSLSVDQSTFMEEVGSRPGLKRVFTFTYQADGNWILDVVTTEGVTETISPSEVVDTLNSYGIIIGLSGGVDTPDIGDKVIITVEEADTTYQKNAHYWADQAKSSQEYLQNLTVSAETLETGEPATVSKEIIGDHENLHFGLPKGDTGDVNFMTFDIDVNPNSNTCGELIMYRPEHITALDIINFDINETTGWLEVQMTLGGNG